MTEQQERLLRYANIPVPWCLQCERPVVLIAEERNFTRSQVIQRLTCHQEVRDRILSAQQLEAMHNAGRL